MFHAYRRDGREGSKQRAINFDGDVVDRVFPSAKDSDKILIDCRCLDDETTVVKKQQWLKRQGKNWRFEGNCPTSDYFKFVEPGVLFAMLVDSSALPATASWVVIPLSHPASELITEHGESAKLLSSGMIALFGSEGAHSARILGEHFSDLFPRNEILIAPPSTTTGDEPDPAGLFDILARAGHRLTSAVADLVDNSISAGATEIDIDFPNPNAGGRWMCIRDNGKGMTPEELRQAMRVGSQRAYGGNDLGKFGYGLKGASWSQADCLTVVSKTIGSPSSVRTWDKDHLVRTGRWEMLSEPVESQYSSYVEIPGAGTAVLLTKMRPPSEVPAVRNIDPYTVEVTELQEHLELVFHRYLEGTAKGREQLTIRINGVPLIANNPMGHPLCKSFDPRTITLKENDPVNKAILLVKACITPNEDEIERHHANEGPEGIKRARDRISLYGRWNETQGLYFYRLDRLIKWGGWEGLFAVDEKTKLLRVAVDFDRKADDPLQVNISKQEIKLPVTVGGYIKEIVKEPRSEARSRYRAIGKAKASTSPKYSTTIPAGSIPAMEHTPALNQTVKPPAFGGIKTKPTKGGNDPIRVVDTGTIPWERKRGFTGEHVEVTPRIPELVDLVRTIESNAEAKIALSRFLHALENADVLKNF
jgi:hypothetical protein